LAAWCGAPWLADGPVRQDPDAGLPMHREDLGMSVTARSAWADPRGSDGHSEIERQTAEIDVSTGVGQGHG
jgi:hypothetical protein